MNSDTIRITDSYDEDLCVLISDIEGFRKKNPQHMSESKVFELEIYTKNSTCYEFTYHTKVARDVVYEEAVKAFTESLKRHTN